MKSVLYSKVGLITIPLFFGLTVILSVHGYAQPTKAAPKAETEAWQKAKAANTFEAAVAFVKQYPRSQFLKEARAMFPRSGRRNYHPTAMTAGLYLDSGVMYAVVEVGGRGKGDKGGSVPLEEGLSKIQTIEERDVWYDIVSSEQVPPGALARKSLGGDASTIIQIVTENLHAYLIYGLSFNFTGRIKPL